MRLQYVTQINPSRPYHVANNSQGTAYGMDGGADVQYHLGLAGEKPAPQVILPAGLPQKTAQEVAGINVAKREYQKQYMDYWNSTTQITGTGRPVDAVVCPVAPHAAVIPKRYDYVGYTSFLNLLDYTSVAIPVTHADKNVDVAQPREFLSEVDEKLYNGCKCTCPFLMLRR